MPSNIVISNEKHLHGVKLHTCHTTPHTVLKNRMFLLYYLYLLIGLMLYMYPIDKFYIGRHKSSKKSHEIPIRH